MHTAVLYVYSSTKFKNFRRNPRRACDAFQQASLRCVKQVEVIYNKVGANAAHLEFHPERPLIAVPSLLEGAVAPHRGAPSAF